MLLPDGQAVESQHEKHCDCSPKADDELLQPFLSGPLVQTYGTAESHGLLAHWAVVQAVHVNSHDVTSQQPSHMCWKGQKVALAEQPPVDAPLSHSYGASMGQRPLASHCACVHLWLQWKRALHVSMLQHAEQIFVLFHASAVLAQPPLLLPALQ